jgi:DNA-binding beta-propeller fold protein YncE
MPGTTRPLLAATALLALSGLGIWSTAASAQILIVGNDQKPGWDKNSKPILNPAGKDSLSIIDISKPTALRMIATIPLDNTIIGPPTNLAISPSRDIALVANSANEVEKDGKPAMASDDRLFVIDLKANPPAVASTLHLGKRPSGMAINNTGNLALVANRDDGTVSVLSISGKDVKVTDTVSVGAAGDGVAAVAITPDGKRALVAKPAVNKVALLTIDNGKATYDKRDLPAGIFPYNVVITPNGKLALTADNGNNGGSDGNADTVTVIDLEANPIRVIDHVTVGDSTEGLTVSPDGRWAASIEARGSNTPKDSWFHHPGGAVTVLKIDGKKVTNAGEVTVGGLPEGGVFSADSRYLFVGNFMDSDLSVLQIGGGSMREVGRVKLPGQPASMRGGPQ